MSCKHVLIGKADGVHCKKCGLYMTPEEYQKYCAPKPQKKVQPKRQAAKQPESEEKA